MSNDGSTIKRALQTKEYKEMNRFYPCVEGYLFQPLDEVLVLASLSDIKFSIGVRIISFIINKDIKFDIRFIREQRRITLYTWSNVGRNRMRQEVIDKISKKFNLTPSKRHEWYSDFEFKYNYKNCRLIVEIFKFLISQEKPR